MSFEEIMLQRIADNYRRKRRRTEVKPQAPKPPTPAPAVGVPDVRGRRPREVFRVNVPTLRRVPVATAPATLRTVPSLRTELAGAVHLCARSEPGGLVAAVRHRDQVAILWTSTDYGLMESVRLWFRRQKSETFEVPLQECGAVGPAVVDAHLSGKVPVYTCVAKHVVAPLVEALRTALPRGVRRGCVVIANDPYSADETPLRTELAGRSKVYRIPIQSEQQVRRCLEHASTRWRHASAPPSDLTPYVDPDARKALIDYHLDQMVCLGKVAARANRGAVAKDTVARGPIEETEAGLWENDPEGVLEYAWCAGLGAAGKPGVRVQGDAALRAAVDYADTISLAATLDPWCKAAEAGWIAGQALRLFDPHTGVKTLPTDGKPEAKRKAADRRLSRGAAYKVNLMARREHNVVRRRLAATEGRDRSEFGYGCLRYESVDTSGFTTPSKAFRRLLAASGTKVTVSKDAVPPCATPCPGRHLADYFGIVEGATNRTVRWACSALAESTPGPITHDAVARDVAWANQNPIVVRRDETPLHAALRNN